MCDDALAMAAVVPVLLEYCVTYIGGVIWVSRFERNTASLLSS